ncbi:GATA-type transcription factor [Sporobolomyces koalae]|uniref:GATA-type transcription factor n=1 Tax=Sporobolomyces koalae TaxID=500713 RepID=UPI003179C075
MSLAPPPSDEVDFSAFVVDESLFLDDSPLPSHCTAAPGSTPTASASSAGSPAPFSPLPHLPESAITSASTSPPFASAEFPKSSKPMDSLPDDFAQIAASLQANLDQQPSPALFAGSAPSTALPLTIGTSLPPYLQSLQSTHYPAHLPLDLINAANLASSSSLPATPHFGQSGASSPNVIPTMYGSMPSTPYPGLNSFGTMSNTAGLDPGLYALHASLEAQARLAATTSMSAPGTPSGFDLLQRPSPQSSSLAGSASTTAASPVHRNSARPASKRSVSSSYIKAAMGVPGTSAPHQRAQTQPTQSGSPLASPALLSNGFDTAGAFNMAPVSSHQRPLPPLPRRQPQSANSAAPRTPAQVPYSNVNADATASLPPSAIHTPSISRAQSPRQPFPPVDYDFSSLEHDLDRFTSSGGFASAAAAAMASVGPAARRGHQGVDAYGVGGYGGSPVPKFAEALPSPKLVADVLGREHVFQQSPNGATLSNQPSPRLATGSSPASANQGIATNLGSFPSFEGGAGKPSPGNSASPAGSTIIDEESAEMLSQKDPIAAQVWRMFHKAKNTMPNGARMENLTWRLMSMTLRKRREESANSGSSSGVPGETANQSSPGTEDASLRRAMEAAIEEEWEEKEVVEEGRDVVQPLAGGRGRTNQTRGRRERIDHSQEVERGRTRGTKNGTASKSASPEAVAAVEAAEAMDWRALSKSRSRSRAPDMMDWRAQSRSRSRAPELRTSIAQPTVDSTPATANFSRFSGDNGISSASTSEMPPPPLPSSTTTSSSSANASRPVIEPLTIPSLPENDPSALAELASSLGLSPQDQAELFGSASARLSQHGLLDLQSQSGGLVSPPTADTSRLTSPGPLSPPSNTFAFPGSNGGVDPNLAAIESALNQLINLQSLASSPASAASPQSPDAVTQAIKSPSTTFAPSPLVNSTELPSAHSRRASGTSSQAQKQLQQLMTKNGSPASSTAPLSRRVSSSTTSAYGNAAALASSTRPFAFGPAPIPASASGISLGRPTNVPQENSQPTSPFLEHSSFGFATSAPSQPQYLGSPNPPLFTEGTDTTHLLYDYFNSQQNNSQHNTSSYQSFMTGSDFGSLPVPTHVDPSQLLHPVETPYGSAGSSWDTHGLSYAESPNGIGSEALPSPPTTSSVQSSKSRLSIASAGGRSSSTSNLSTLSSSLPSSSSKTKSAPTSRAHSRSNTISVQPPIHEGKPLDLSRAVGDGVAASDSKKEDSKDDGLTRCLNCSTTNTPLWRRDADGKPLCNACGLFRNLHGVDRPAGLNTGVIKRRNRNRGPKEPGTKKATKTGPARRNSIHAAGTQQAISTPSGSSRKERSGASAPYPNAAQRAQQE